MHFSFRTARFGSALLLQHPGSISLKSTKFRTDFRPIDETCDCSTCRQARATSNFVVTFFQLAEVWFNVFNYLFSKKNFLSLY
jgi:tRNA-guanine family transglycosylase